MPAILPAAALERTNSPFSSTTVTPSPMLSRMNCKTCGGIPKEKTAGCHSPPGSVGLGSFMLAHGDEREFRASKWQGPESCTAVALRNLIVTVGLSDFQGPRLKSFAARDPNAVLSCCRDGSRNTSSVDMGLVARRGHAGAPCPV